MKENFLSHNETGSRYIKLIAHSFQYRVKIMHFQYQLWCWKCEIATQYIENY